ncbi:MAG: hypothetical protein LBS77_04755, partial [Desulfovibrio sp.]|nr:hypothetical protein [Desulfovibrio sp.]
KTGIWTKGDSPQKYIYPGKTARTNAGMTNISAVSGSWLKIPFSSGSAAVHTRYVAVWANIC